MFVPLSAVRIYDEAQRVHVSKLFVILQFKQLAGQAIQAVPFLIVPEGQEDVQTPLIKILVELVQDKH
jgi:hypothetical protein